MQDNLGCIDSEPVFVSRIRVFQTAFVPVHPPKPARVVGRRRRDLPGCAACKREERDHEFVHARRLPFSRAGSNPRCRNSHDRLPDRLRTHKPIDPRRARAYSKIQWPRCGCRAARREDTKGRRVFCGCSCRRFACGCAPHGMCRCRCIVTTRRFGKWGRGAAEVTTGDL
jgi:hypothetical protein